MNTAAPPLAPVKASPWLLRLRHYLVADAQPLSRAERWRSALAALAGMLLLQGILTLIPLGSEVSHLLAPLGATSIILFALPHSPLGQPWPMAAGLLLCALTGWLCGTWIHPEVLAIASAVAVSVWLMAFLRCIHPPGGAMAIVCVFGAAHPELLLTVALNVLVMLLVVLVINNLLPGRRYPLGLLPPAPSALPQPRSAIEHDDLRHALGTIDTYLDISEEDLVEVYEQATAHALQRHERRVCAEIMTPDPLCIEYGDSLNDAWALLRRHRLKALPVIDRSRRLIGLLTLDDFLQHIAPDPGRSIAANIQRLLQGSGTSHSERPEVVGQIMQKGAVVAHTTDSIVHIAALLSARTHPALIPVLDAEERVVGALSQTDVLSALYHQRVTDLAASGAPHSARAASQEEKTRV
ncbi:MAG: HPP family protein [Rhodocyclaceae bacterium]